MLAALRAHRARVSTDTWTRPPAGTTDLLLGTLRSSRPTLAYLIPEFQNPTGHLMPVELREQLPAAAHRAGTDLVIDESFVDLPLDGTVPPPVAAFDRHARVLTVGGMTKPYWGGLRVGWIRAPAPVIARLAAARVAVDMAGPVLDQLVALRLLDRAGEVVAGPPGAAASRQRDALAAALRSHLPAGRSRLPGGRRVPVGRADAPVSTALAHAALEPRRAARARSPLRRRRHPGAVPAAAVHAARDGTRRGRPPARRGRRGPGPRPPRRLGSAQPRRLARRILTGERSVAGPASSPVSAPWRARARSPVSAAQEQAARSPVSRVGQISARAPSYIFSISAAKLVSTPRRLIFSDGVSSPSSMDRSRGRMVNFLTVSQRLSLRVQLLDVARRPSRAASGEATISA